MQAGRLHSQFIDFGATAIQLRQQRRQLGGRVIQQQLQVAAILAHEFGHIVQFFSTYYRQLRKAHRTVKLVELHADFLAGYFVARRRERFPDLRLQGLGEAWEAMGDVDYNNPKHHGTSAERLKAIEQGYFWGRDSGGGIREAAESGAAFIKDSFT